MFKKIANWFRPKTQATRKEMPFAIWTPSGYIAYFFGRDVVVARNERDARRQYLQILKTKIRPTSFPIIKKAPKNSVDLSEAV